jgi:predicted nucleic acid-binding protein
MKEKFVEYHIVDYLDNIYKESIIVLDTNSLLNLYRYSKDTRNKYLEILNKVENRLYLTYHVCSEFYKNRYNLIGNRAFFKETINELIDENQGKLLNIIKNSSGSSKYNSALGILKHEEELKNKIVDEIEKSSKKIKKYIESFKHDIDFKFIQQKDPILAEVVEIFKDKISVEITNEEKQKIYKNGEERFKNLVPPGYKDNAKDFPEKYGDLIIWNELINLAKEQKKDILFVSDDRKEDWVIEFKGMDLGPRKELIKEFNKETEKLFYSITTKEFIKIISESYSIKDTESLEMETEIIHNKIQEDGYSFKDSIEDLYNPESLEKANDLREYYRKNYLINEAMKDPFKDYTKREKLLKKGYNSSIENYLKKQKFIEDAFDSYNGQREMFDIPKSLSVMEILEKHGLLNKDNDDRDDSKSDTDN